MRLSSKGFSYFETLIAVILIAVLIAIVNNKFNEISNEAKRNISEMDLKIINYNIKLYQMREGKYPATLEILYKKGYIDNNSTSIKLSGSRIADNIVYDAFSKPHFYDNVSGLVK